MGWLERVRDNCQMPSILFQWECLVNVPSNVHDGVWLRFTCCCWNIACGDSVVFYWLAGKITFRLIGFHPSLLCSHFSKLTEGENLRQWCWGVNGTATRCRIILEPCYVIAACFKRRVLSQPANLVTKKITISQELYDMYCYGNNNLVAVSATHSTSAVFIFKNNFSPTPPLHLKTS